MTPHGVDVVKIVKLRFAPKKEQKRGVTWNFGESWPTMKMVLIYVRGFMYHGYAIPISAEPHPLYCWSKGN